MRSEEGKRLSFENAEQGEAADGKGNVV